MDYIFLYICSLIVPWLTNVSVIIKITLLDKTMLRPFIVFHQELFEVNICTMKAFYLLKWEIPQMGDFRLNWLFDQFW